MQSLISFVTHATGFLTLMAHIALLIFLFAYLQKKKPWAKELFEAIGAHGLWIGLVIALGGTAVSLFFSEFAHYIPCELCWIQRIFLYPQVILFTIAIVKKDSGIALYSIWLSIFGGAVALYQYYIQLGGAAIVPCSQGFGASCLTKYTNEFGYISIPLMSLTAFVLIICVMAATKRIEAGARG